MVFICVEFSPFPAGRNAIGMRRMTRRECGSDQESGDQAGWYENMAPIMMDTWDAHNESKGSLQNQSGWGNLDQQYTETRPPTWRTQHALIIGRSLSGENETII